MQDFFLVVLFLSFAQGYYLRMQVANVCHMEKLGWNAHPPRLLGCTFYSAIALFFDHFSYKH